MNQRDAELLLDGRRFDRAILNIDPPIVITADAFLRADAIVVVELFFRARAIDVLKRYGQAVVTGNTGFPPTLHAVMRTVAKLKYEVLSNWPIAEVVGQVVALWTVCVGV